MDDVDVNRMRICEAGGELIEDIRKYELLWGRRGWLYWNLLKKYSNVTELNVKT